MRIHLHLPRLASCLFWPIAKSGVKTLLLNRRCSTIRIMRVTGAGQMLGAGLHGDKEMVSSQSRCRPPPCCQLWVKKAGCIP